MRMEEIRFIETPKCAQCRPRPEYRRRYACMGCGKLLPPPPKRAKKRAAPARPKNPGVVNREAIRAMRERGYSYGRIARELGLARSTVQGVLLRAQAGGGPACDSDQRSGESGEKDFGQDA